MLKIDRKKLLWVFGPCSYIKDTGIGTYSKLFIHKLRHMFNIEILCIRYYEKSFKRYFEQLFLYPLKIVLSRNKICILYEEGFIYLVPFIKFFNKKVVIIYHHIHIDDSLNDSLKSKWLKIKSKLIHFMSSKFLKITDKIVVPSYQTKEKLKETYNLSDSNINVIYNAFDLETLKENIELIKKNELDLKKDFFSKFNIKYSPNKIILLNVGTDEDRKNIHTFIKAFSIFCDKKENNKFIFINVGRSISEKNRIYIDNLVKKHKLPAFFVGKVDSNDLNRFYLYSHFYISPSIHEGFGRTVIEAQIYGLPVICSDIPVYREILADSAYYVKNPHVETSWINLLYNFDEVISIRNKLRMLGYENIKRFDINILYKKWENLIKKL